MAKMIFVNPPVTPPVDAMAGSVGETGSDPDPTPARDRGVI